MDVVSLSRTAESAEAEKPGMYLYWAGLSVTCSVTEPSDSSL